MKKILKDKLLELLEILELIEKFRGEINMTKEEKDKLLELLEKFSLEKAKEIGISMGEERGSAPLDEVIADHCQHCKLRRENDPEDDYD